MCVSFVYWEKRIVRCRQSASLEDGYELLIDEFLIECRRRCNKCNELYEIGRHVSSLTNLDAGKSGMFNTGNRGPQKVQEGGDYGIGSFLLHLDRIFRLVRTFCSRTEMA